MYKNNLTTNECVGKENNVNENERIEELFAQMDPRTRAFFLHILPLSEALYKLGDDIPADDAPEAD